jgi:cysteine-rich repeat protein
MPHDLVPPATAKPAPPTAAGPTPTALPPAVLAAPSTPPPDQDSGGTDNPGTGTDELASTKHGHETVPARPACGNGIIEAGEQCDDGNTGDGDGCSSSCLTEAAPPKPVPVDPKVLRGLRINDQRIAGDTQILPGRETLSSMVRNGVTRVSGIVGLCVATTGEVTEATTRKTTGYPEYDDKLVAGVHNWRYRPYVVNGSPVPVCSTIELTYTHD